MKEVKKSLILVLSTVEGTKTLMHIICNGNCFVLFRLRPINAVGSQVSNIFKIIQHTSKPGKLFLSSNHSSLSSSSKPQVTCFLKHFGKLCTSLNVLLIRYCVFCSVQYCKYLNDIVRYDLLHFNSEYFHTLKTFKV